MIDRTKSYHLTTDEAETVLDGLLWLKYRANVPEDKEIIGSLIHKIMHQEEYGELDPL